MATRAIVIVAIAASGLLGQAHPALAQGADVTIVSPKDGDNVEWYSGTGQTIDAIFLIDPNEVPHFIAAKIYLEGDETKEFYGWSTNTPVEPLAHNFTVPDMPGKNMPIACIAKVSQLNALKGVIAFAESHITIFDRVPFDE